MKDTCNTSENLDNDVYSVRFFLAAIHKLRHPLRGEGVCQKTTLVYKPI